MGVNMALKTRAVLVGCGGISNAWLSSLQKMPSVEIVGLVDVRLQAALDKKSGYKLSRAEVGDDLRSMLRLTKPEVVFDCTLPGSHMSVTLEALRHGCHVLGEKPLSDSMPNARRMVAAARKAGKIYTVIQNRRYNLCARGFHQFLHSGRIGHLTTLFSDFFIGAHFGGFRDTMQHVLLLDMAIHTFDAARFIAGADPLAVYCHEWNPRGSWYRHDASALAVFEMTNGVVYTYRGSWCSEGLNTSWESTWRANGTKGSATWDGADLFRAQAVAKRGGFSCQLKDLTIKVPKPGKQGGHNGNIAEFVRCVRRGGTPETICTDNIKSLAMVFGAIESAQTGCKVKIRS